jgi:hypothetical protein
VHSTQSDGSGTPEAIAAAASAAGLDFVILTDHGDATRAPAPPRLVAGVLLIDGVEISTDDGHYVALDLPQAPYPLAGEGRAVAEDVNRLGGIGILAHPDSTRPALAWQDPSVSADGFEWINADSEWRSASRMQLLSTLLAFPFNPAGALAKLGRYPAVLFADRDQPSRPPQLALAAVDAHARIGWQRDDDAIPSGRTLARFPSYRDGFGTFGVVVPWLNDAPSGDARRDARTVLHAIRDRTAWTAVFSMASPVWLSLDLIEPDATALAAPDARGTATLVVRSNKPDDATIRVLRNGRMYREVPEASWSLPLPPGAAAAVYRAELWLPARRGWPPLPLAVSAARGHNLPDWRSTGAGNGVPRTEDRVSDAGNGASGPGRQAGTVSDAAIDIKGWHVEHDARSTATLRPASADARAGATLHLADGPRVSQFAALVADLVTPPAWATALELELSASAPMRLSLQWRQPLPGEGLRWRDSTYVDRSRRTAVLPVEAFRPISPASGPVPLDRVHALLFVMDTVNAKPGDSRTVTVHAAGWVRGR